MKQTATITMTADTETGALNCSLVLDPPLPEGVEFDLDNYPAAAIAGSIMQLLAEIHKASTEED